jgi:hypothetical protein
MRGTSNTGSGSNVFNRRQRDYGVIGYDRTHSLNIAYSWLMPDVFHGNAVGKAVVNGWQFTGISIFQSGVNLGAITGNFSVEARVTGSDGNLYSLGNEQVKGTDAGTIQPFVTCDPREGLKPGQYVNGACFAPPQLKKNGNYQFPYVRGPMYMNNDLSVYKNFQIGTNENRKLQFRFAAYNFLNHPLPSFEGTGDAGLKLTFVDGKLQNRDFGSTKIKYGKRIVQFAIKFMF